MRLSELLNWQTSDSQLEGIKLHTYIQSLHAHLQNLHWYVAVKQGKARRKL